MGRERIKGNCVLTADCLGGLDREWEGKGYEWRVGSEGKGVGELYVDNILCYGVWIMCGEGKGLGELCVDSRLC